MGGSRNSKLVNKKIKHTNIDEYEWEVPVVGKKGPIKNRLGDEMIVSMKNTNFGQNWTRKDAGNGWFSLKNEGTGEFLKPYGSDVYIIGKGTFLDFLLGF